VKNPTVLAVRSGDNKAEAKIAGVKRRMRRRNALQSPRHAGAQFLASNWVLYHPGPEGLPLAVSEWLTYHVDRVNPVLAWPPGKQTAKDAAAPVLAGTLVRRRPASAGRRA